tara:strand:+ start:114 stop:395 length:282 start_codon:yes stop_codon:yes gene_type:complete
MEKMNEEFFKEDGMNYKAIQKYLDDLEKSSIDKYYRLCYGALMESPEEMLAYEGDIKTKLRGINKLITYFLDKEEYEKCADLDKLLKMLPKYE